MKYALKYCAIFLASLVGMALIAVVIFVNSQHAGFETRYKYWRAEKDYPDLNYVTVNDLAAMLKKDTADFKIVAFSYGISSDDGYWGTTIVRDMIPKWLELDTTRVSFYLVENDCSLLSYVDEFVKTSGFGAHTFVIRDNSKGVRSYDRLIFPNDMRITNIIRKIAPSENASMLDAVSMRSSMILDKENNLKLVHLYDKSPNVSKSVVVPMYFNLVECLDSLDFTQIDDIIVTNDNAYKTRYSEYF